MKTIMRLPIWPGILLAVAIVGLLTTFHQVVRSAVQQGESRRQAFAVHADAERRCKALRGLRLRDACLVVLNAAAGDTRPMLPEHVGVAE